MLEALYHGPCERVLADLSTNLCHAMVTDPPAGINFLGIEWDSDRGGRDKWIAWAAGIFAQCKRVLVPGANVVVWAFPRTSHWTATALEDAGFEIRDVAVHLNGQGFLKSKALLRPNSEHWILAKTPGPVRDLNHDACMIGDGPKKRMPCNVTLEHANKCTEMCARDCPIRMLDAQSGVLKSGAMAKDTKRSRTDFYSGSWSNNAAWKDILADEGGASRFYYCAKERRYKTGGHPTQKPLDLMRWLCRLVCPDDGIVLDPFAGAGTTLLAAKQLGLGYVGIEQDKKYFAMAGLRLHESRSA